MDDLLLNFELLKISAFSKVKQINCAASQYSINLDDKINHQFTKTNSLEDGNATSETGMPMKHILKELEIQRREEVKNAVKTHVNKFEEFSREQEVSKKHQLSQQHQAIMEVMLQNESSIFQAISEFDKNNYNGHTKLVQHYQDLAERRKIRERELELQAKQRQVLNDNIDNIRKQQQNFRSVYQQIIPVIKTCTDNEELKNLLGDDLKLLKILPEQLDEIIMKCKSGNVGKDEVLKASEIVTQLNALKTSIEENVNKANNKKAVAEEPLPVLTAISSHTENFQQRNVLDNSKIISKGGGDITHYVNLKNLRMYADLMDFLDKHSASFEQLEIDDSQKKFKFDCKKAINTPVNSLSGISSQHILDKYNRLYRLLSGQTVTVSEKQINASSHPQGIAFCMDLLARKFVLQGDLMVSSNPESAFCYASVIISLWTEFPVFGKLILAYFYKFCPYLVPYYIPRQVGESDEDFYTKQGYQYNEGQVEKQDKFLKRMTGITRLYSALLIAKPKKGQNSTPYNIQHGWRWMSALLKLEPRVDITATVLHTFLETVAFEMDAKYGIVFKKIIRIIIEKFLPSCREKCTGGAVTRLELLLNEYVKNRKFDPPSGYFSYSYW